MMTVAFYSLGTPYEAEAVLLSDSLDRVGMPHEITGVPDRGGWYANTAYKATFLRERREAHFGPLLYVDVDAFVHQNCSAYFDGLQARGYDFGAHWFRGPAKGHDKSKVTEAGERMLSGTLFMADTPACRTLLAAWCDLNALLGSYGATQGGGQKNLWFLWRHFEKTGAVKFARLPGRYCYVFDKPWAYDPREPRIIEHTIASRQRRPLDGQDDDLCHRDNPKRRERISQLGGRLCR